MSVWTSFWFWLTILSIIGFVVVFITIQTVSNYNPPMWIWFVYGISLLLLVVAFILYCYRSAQHNNMHNEFVNYYYATNTKPCMVAPAPVVLQEPVASCGPQIREPRMIQMPSETMSRLADPTCDRPAPCRQPRPVSPCDRQVSFAMPEVKETCDRPMTSCDRLQGNRKYVVQQPSSLTYQVVTDDQSIGDGYVIRNAAVNQPLMSARSDPMTMSARSDQMSVSLRSDPTMPVSLRSDQMTMTSMTTPPLVPVEESFGAARLSSLTTQPLFVR